MDSMGLDFNVTGSVMTKAELEEIRKKRGECTTCGQKCFKKKLFKMVPLDVPGKVVNGRCLNCQPIQPKDVHIQSAAVAVARRTSRTDLERFSISQSNLGGSQSNRQVLRSPSGGLVGGRAPPPRTPSSTSNQHSSLRTSRTIAGMGRGQSTRSMESTGSYSVHSQQQQQQQLQQQQSQRSMGAGPPPLQDTRTQVPLTIQQQRQHQHQQQQHQQSASSGLSQVETPKQHEMKHIPNNSAASSKTDTPTTTSSTTTGQGQDRGSSFTSRESRSHNSHEIASLDDHDEVISSNTNINNDNNNNNPSAPPPPPAPTNGPTGSRRVAATASPRSLQSPSATSRSSSSSSMVRHKSGGSSGRSLVPAQRSSSYVAAASAAPAAASLPSSDEIRHARETSLATQHNGSVGGDSEKNGAFSIHHSESGPSTTSGMYQDDGRRQSSSSVDEYDLDLVIDPGAVDDLQDDPNGYVGGHYDHDDDDAVAFDVTLSPRGVLNRGGTFPAVNPSRTHSTDNRAAETGRSSHHGSSRTLSSMSSMEEDERDGEEAERIGHQHRHRSKADYSNHHDDADNYIQPMNDPVEVSESNESFTAPAFQHGQGHEGFTPSEEELLCRIYDSADDYEEIMAVLRDGQDSSVVVKEALVAIKSMDLRENELDHLHEIHAPLVVVNSLNCHKSDVRLVSLGLLVMYDMTATCTNQLAFLDVGAVDAIFDCMGRFIDHADIQLEALKVLFNLAVAPESCPAFLQAGVVDRLKAVFEKHNDEEKVYVLTQGFSTVANIAEAFQDRKEEVVGLGEPIVSSMVAHADDEELQCSGLRALRCLSAGNSNNKTILEERFCAIDVVIAAMGMHREHAELQAEGAWVLSNLAENADNNDIIGDSGGIDVMVRSLWVHTEDEDVLERSAQGIFTLCVSSPRNRSILSEVDGDSALINAMMGNVESVAIQILCCEVLRALCLDNEEVKVRVVGRQCLDAVAMAMLAHPEDAVLQHAACQLLFSLAIDDNYEAIFASQVVHLVEIATGNFPHEIEVPIHNIFATLIEQSEGSLE